MKRKNANPLFFKLKEESEVIPEAGEIIWMFENKITRMELRITLKKECIDFTKEQIDRLLGEMSALFLQESEQREFNVCLNDRNKLSQFFKQNLPPILLEDYMLQLDELFSKYDSLRLAEQELQELGIRLDQLKRDFESIQGVCLTTSYLIIS